MRGSVFKRGTAWTAQVYLGRDPVTAKKRYKQVGGFRTRKAAEAALTEMLGRVGHGGLPTPGAATVGEFLSSWLDSVCPTVRPTTAASYRDLVEGLVVPRVGGVRLAQLTPPVLSRLYNELLVTGRRRGTGGLSPTTVRYVHRILVHAFGDAVRWRLLPGNPAEMVDPPRAPHAEMRTWSVVELRCFLAAIQDDRLFAMWLLLATTGMRRGEVLGLQWSDVNFTNATVSVRRQVVDVAYSSVVAEPKTARGRRLVALDAFSAQALVEHHERQAKRADLGVLTPALFVFTRPDGSLLQPQNVSKSFRNIVRRLDLPLIRLHDLRHTAASHALEAGIHPKVVSERLGHASIQVTLDRYSHVVPALDRHAAELIAERLFGGDERRLPTERRGHTSDSSG